LTIAAPGRTKQESKVQLSPINTIYQDCITIGMLQPVAFLIDCQRSPHQRLGLREPVGGLQ
jgi:hypothetical protein